MTDDAVDAISVVCPQCGVELELPKDVPTGQHVSCSECGCRFSLSEDAPSTRRRSDILISCIKMVRRSLAFGLRYVWSIIKSSGTLIADAVERYVWPTVCARVRMLEEMLRRNVSPKVSLSPRVCLVVLALILAWVVSAVGFNSGTSSGKISASNMRRKTKSASFQTGSSTRMPSDSNMKKKQPVSNMKRETSNADSLDRSEGGGDKFRGEHSFTTVERQICLGGEDFTFRIEALPNGGYNTIIWEGKYEAPRSVKLYKERGDIREVAEPSVVVRPLTNSAKLLSVKMVVFNGDVSKVFGAFRSAFHKAREWIALGKKNGRTLSEPMDMNIEVPDGCALEIPGAEDTWYVFNKLASSADLKKKKSWFKFKFSDEIRVLRFQCGDVIFDCWWYANQDEKLADVELACDERTLLQLYTGLPGEADLFRADQKCSKIPSVKNSSEAPKWEGFSDEATLKFPYGRMAGVVLCSDGSFNYCFFPRWLKAYLTTALIFPGNSYDDAYYAIEEAFGTALAWRSVAQKHHVLNIVKEMEISCPKSAPVEITGKEGAAKLLWKSFRNADQLVLPTRFWFSIETSPSWENGGWVFKQENSHCGIYFGNELVKKCIPINDTTIAAFSGLNPQLALRAIEAAIRDKANEKSIFK